MNEGVHVAIVNASSRTKWLANEGDCLSQRPNSETEGIIISFLPTSGHFIKSVTYLLMCSRSPLVMVPLLHDGALIMSVVSLGYVWKHHLELGNSSEVHLHTSLVRTCNWTSLQSKGLSCFMEPNMHS